MEPLRVIAGVRETIAHAVLRLRAHQASAAPVVSAGRPVGLVTRSLMENALRHGLGAARLGEVAVGGAPRVPATAGLQMMKHRVQGTAPGLVVGSTIRTPQGVVTRHRLEEAIQRQIRPGVPPTWLLGRDIGARMNKLLGEERADLLRRAGGLAGVQGVGLYLAGGVVRDLLLGRSSKDLDLVIEGDGVAFAQELGTLLGAEVTRHDAFGTAVLAWQDGGRIDVASARRETYDTPSMLPRVTPGSMFEDLVRRDVTINSMAIRLDGGLYGRLSDELGGERDLRLKLLRVNHALSLTEDPTRAFRVARLAGRLGFTVAPETLVSLELAHRARAFESLTGERLFREFSLIAIEEAPASALRWCARLGLLAALGPGLRWDSETERSVLRLARGFQQRLFPEISRGASERALLLLVLLSWRTRPDHRTTLAERLRITGDGAERLRSGAAGVSVLLRALASARRPSRIVQQCEEVPADRLAVAWALSNGASRKALDLYFGKLRLVRPSVTGDTLKKLGMPPGPGYREVLAAIRQALLDGRVRDDVTERELALRLVTRRSRRKDDQH